jgi:hypothetical protein
MMLWSAESKILIKSVLAKLTWEYQLQVTDPCIASLPYPPPFPKSSDCHIAGLLQYPSGIQLNGNGGLLLLNNIKFLFSNNI